MHLKLMDAILYVIVYQRLILLILISLTLNVALSVYYVHYNVIFHLIYCPTFSLLSLVLPSFCAAVILLVVLII
jgi:hypothetical protein